MGMTNKQFQGFIRLSEMSLDRIIEIIKKDLPEDNPAVQEAEKLRETYQSMLEDAN